MHEGRQYAPKPHDSFVGGRSQHLSKSYKTFGRLRNSARPCIVVSLDSQYIAVTLDTQDFGISFTSLLICGIAIPQIFLPQLLESCVPVEAFSEPDDFMLRLTCPLSVSLCYALHSLLFAL